jgi:hypothetical protein
MTAAKTGEGDPLFKTVVDMKSLACHARFAANDALRKSKALHAFELGMIAEAKQSETRMSWIPGDNIRDRVAEVCELCGKAAMEYAVPQLYDRGHTMYIPLEAQQGFLRRIEIRTGWQLRRWV